MKLQYHK